MGSSPQGGGGKGLIYSFVAREDTILVEYTAFTGNFSTLAVESLSSIRTSFSAKAAGGLFCYACDGYTFNFEVHSGLTFLVVAGEHAGREMPFAFLRKLRDDFLRKLRAEAATALTNSLDAQYRSTLKELMEAASANPQEFSKVAQVRQQVEEVKSVMMDNIEQVLDRGDRIELLVDKTEELRFQADHFQSSGRSLRRKLWWSNVKHKLIIAFFALGAIFAALTSVCLATQLCLKKE